MRLIVMMVLWIAVPILLAICVDPYVPSGKMYELALGVAAALVLYFWGLTLLHIFPSSYAYKYVVEQIRLGNIQRENKLQERYPIAGSPKLILRLNLVPPDDTFSKMLLIEDDLKGSLRYEFDAFDTLRIELLLIEKEVDQVKRLREILNKTPH